MTTPACSVIDLERYRELRCVSSSARSAQPAGCVSSASLAATAFQPPAPDLSEALTLLGRELRSAELRLIDLAATIDELYAQVDEMARR